MFDKMKNGKISLKKNEKEEAPAEPPVVSSETPGTAPEDPIIVEPPEVIQVMKEPVPASVLPPLPPVYSEQPPRHYNVFYTKIQKDLVAEIEGIEELDKVLEELKVAKEKGLIAPDVRVELVD